MDQHEQWRQAIASLERQERELGLDFSGQIAALQRRLTGVGEIAPLGSSAVASTDGVAVGEGGIAVKGDVGGHVIVAHDGARISLGDQPITITAVDRESATGRYLSHVIGRNRYLQLQGIRSGGRLVNIELERIYITLRTLPSRTLPSRTLEAEDARLNEERALLSSEGPGLDRGAHPAAVSVKVEAALAAHKRLVILGDPGSGKTTLLRYFALGYARDRAESGSTVVRDRFGLSESGMLPILLPLRNLGAYLKANYPVDDGTEGHARLLAFLRAYLRGERIEVPDDFFDQDLHSGRAVLLFDGMDEVGDVDLRRRVARLIENTAQAYPECRFVVTSRIVGYTGSTRLAEAFVTSTVEEFSLSDVRQFLDYWHQLVAIGQMGPTESAAHAAAEQTEHLMQAIASNPRVRELAINPLMLTVIALVHRDRVELPERRADLYAEAVDVLLGKWDEARGVEESRILEHTTFDTSDRRLLLQSIALKMHEAGDRDITEAALQAQLQAAFEPMTPDSRGAQQATERFLTVVKERTGLLVEVGQDVYRFSHLTFQEYLAAVEVAEREDYVSYTLRHTAEPFWREVILLEAGYLSAKNRGKTTRLIEAIASASPEPELFYNLVLAAECLRDAGPTRVEGEIASRLTERLQSELNAPIPDESRGWTRLLGQVTGAPARRRALITRRLAAATALSRIESGQYGGGGRYWTQPYGEPEWITVPEGSNSG